jgi:hypothetical protein
VSEPIVVALQDGLHVLSRWELEAAALAAMAALDEHRHYWTSDEGNDGAVSIRTYAEAVNREDGAIYQ